MNDFCFGDDFDLEIDENGEPKLSDSLKTSIYLSLFTDARCLDLEIPILEKSPRGYWGDSISDYATGSKLWLIQKSKLSQDVAIRAKEYAEECLSWIVEDGFANELEVNSYFDLNEKLNLQIIIDKTEYLKIEDVHAVYQTYFN